MGIRYAHGGWRTRAGKAKNTRFELDDFADVVSRGGGSFLRGAA